MPRPRTRLSSLSLSPDLLKWARTNGADITVTTSADVAVAGATCVVTDAWVSMHDAVITNGRLQAGESVLVQGVTSSMGLAAFQIAMEMESSEVNDIYSHLTSTTHTSMYLWHRKLATLAPGQIGYLADAARRFGAGEEIVRSLDLLKEECS